jgi:hypothetical protein
MTGSSAHLTAAFSPDFGKDFMANLLIVDLPL